MPELTEPPSTPEALDGESWDQVASVLEAAGADAQEESLSPQAARRGRALSPAGNEQDREGLSSLLKGGKDTLQKPNKVSKRRGIKSKENSELTPRQSRRAIMQKARVTKSQNPKNDIRKSDTHWVPSLRVPV